MSGAGGDSRLTARDQVKDGKRLPAQVMASPTQEAKAAHAKAERVEKREAAFTTARMQEAEDAAAFEAEQAAAARLQEATGLAAVEGLP